MTTQQNVLIDFEMRIAMAPFQTKIVADSTSRHTVSIESFNDFGDSSVVSNILKAQMGLQLLSKILGNEQRGPRVEKAKRVNSDDMVQKGMTSTKTRAKITL